MVQTWQTVCVVDCNDNPIFLLLSCGLMFHVSAAFLTERESPFSYPIFEFGLGCVLLWPRECGRYASVPVLGLHLKKLCVSLPALWSLCHHHKKTRPCQASGEGRTPGGEPSHPRCPNQGHSRLANNQPTNLRTQE